MCMINFRGVVVPLLHMLGTIMAQSPQLGFSILIGLLFINSIIIAGNFEGITKLTSEQNFPPFFIFFTIYNLVPPLAYFTCGETRDGRVKCIRFHMEAMVRDYTLDRSVLSVKNYRAFRVEDTSCTGTKFSRIAIQMQKFEPCGKIHSIRYYKRLFQGWPRPGSVASIAPPLLP